MMVILNPTSWPITVKWNGLDHVFKPDERKPVEDPMGRQIVHNYARRGLVELNYGDEGEIELRKAEEGRQRCDEFWTKQVVTYNEDNIRRRDENRPYVRPSDEVKFHAKRLGIKVIEPYRLEDTSSKEIKLLMDQNAALQKEVASKDEIMAGLQRQVSELTENFKKLMSLAQPAENPKGGNGGSDFDAETIKATIGKMGKKKFAAWVVNKWDEIQDYPPEVKDGIAIKHESMFGGPLPKKKPELESYDV